MSWLCWAVGEARRQVHWYQEGWGPQGAVRKEGVALGQGHEGSNPSTASYQLCNLASDVAFLGLSFLINEKGPLGSCLGRWTGFPAG